MASFSISSEEKIAVLENVSMQVQAGMDIMRAVNAIEEDISSRSMRRILDEVKQDIDAGEPLWKSIKKTGLYSDHVVSLMRIGEESGRLPENLQILVLQLQKDRMFRSRIRSALLYPVFILVLTVVVGVLIATFILPRLSRVFDALNVELPTITKVVIGIGEFFDAYGLFVIPILAVGMGAFLYVLFFNKKTRWIGQFLLFLVPGIRKVLVQSEMGRFGYLLGTLLQAGVPIVDSLASVSGATTLRAYSRLYEHLAHEIGEGVSLRKSLKSFPGVKKLVPSAIQQLIAAGEQSGRLAETLISVGQTFERKTETATKNLSVILEPILLVIVWGGVVILALSVVLPVYELIGGFSL